MLHCLLMSSPFGIFPLFRWLNEAGLRRFVQNKDSQGLLFFFFIIPIPVIVWGSSIWLINIALTMEQDSKA